MTIEEVRLRKSRLEDDIHTLIRRFQDDTDVKVESIEWRETKVFMYNSSIDDFYDSSLEIKLKSL